jgi:DUF1680 family protein
MRILICLLLSTIMFGCAGNNVQRYDYPLSAINIDNVKLTDNFWLPQIKTIQSVTIPYAFDKCDKEGRMENFLIAGGRLEGKTRGKMPFDDTDLYKIIEGASYSLISNPNPGLDAYLDSLIEIIKTGQEADGYITTWFTIDRAHPPANWVKPSKSRWENEISSHELYNSGHLFEAASAHYFATRKSNFLNIALKNADLLADNFGPGKKQIVPGHQIVETGLIKLYRITGKAKYLELAKFFLDQRGNSSTRELYGAYSQDHVPVTQQTEVVGHAVRAVYMYAAMTDIAAMYRDPAYQGAVHSLWENMVNAKLYLTGGIGARHEGESFGDNYELPNLTAYAETCAAIGSVYWSQRMFLLTGEGKYYDLIERTLYNGLISGISLDGTTFFYPNPLESDGKFTFNMGAGTRQPWFDCSCCPTNLIRFIPSIPGLIYAVSKDSLCINLFAANEAKASISGVTVNISQKTDYPRDGHVAISLDPDKPKKFTMKVRVPYWTTNQPTPGTLYQYLDKDPGQIALRINGKDEDPVYDKGYMVITKKWAKGDEIEVNLPMSVRRVVADEKVKDDQNLVALEYGPMVYCAEEIDNGDMLAQLQVPEDAELIAGHRDDLLNGVTVLTGDISRKDSATGQIAKGKEEFQPILVPYYSWSNRGVGKMRVWLAR